MTILESEREKATFNVEEMTDILNGGKSQTLRRRWIFSSHEGVTNQVMAELPRESQITQSVTHFMQVHAEHFERGFIPKDMDLQFMSDARMTNSALSINFGVFSSTLRSHASDEQKKWFLDRSQKGRILGCYAQTELGHGSNVRGILTTATYDEASEEWVIHTPSVEATKWWSTGMPFSTHALVFAQTFVNGKHCGLNMFIVPLRNEQLLPLPGIEVGDIGETLGERDASIGYCRFNHVRIPRRFLLERRVHVTKEGEWRTGPHPGSMDVKSKQQTIVDPKMAQALKYVTMMKTRIALASTAAGALAKACTITARFSCVRRQGFVGQSKTEERQIIDYSVQLYRVLKWIATAYAYKGVTMWLVRRRRQIQSGGEVNLEDLPEVHALGSGLKAETTCKAADGIEDLRRCCGGHGYLMSSGIAALEADFKGPNATAEGDPILLCLQTARFLMKSVVAARKGETLSGLTECLNLLQDPRFDPSRDGRARLGVKEFPSAEDLQDHRYLVRLFQWRSLVTISRASARLDLLQSKMSAEDAWNQAARILVSATRCHVRFFIIEKFAQQISQVEDLPCKKVLSMLCALYGVSDLLEGEQWSMSDTTLAVAEDACSALCQGLRGEVVGLTDAFDFPDRVLNSALGRSDALVYETLLDEARNSAVNALKQDGTPEVPGFLNALKPYLDLQFLKEQHKLDSTSNSKL